MRAMKNQSIRDPYRIRFKDLDAPLPALCQSYRRYPFEIRKRKKMEGRVGDRAYLWGWSRGRVIHGLLRELDRVPLDPSPLEQLTRPLRRCQPVTANKTRLISLERCDVVISVRKIVCTVVEDAEDIPDIFLDKVQVINDVRTDKGKSQLAGGLRVDLFHRRSHY
ncbi:hypothetical protein OUZ56_006987 [Daphnia magna]|uniref:Uncharacterized protein n=1 Tax=Daphnia magna TaxID=35525 RepID=A0ABQ9YX97_9CRUS|nr:hypothetical protein OUZ56_006987 [Daphnia magna]